MSNPIICIVCQILLFVMCMSHVSNIFSVICILLRLIIKHWRGRLACVWGRMLWCLQATCPPAPPFLLNYITRLPWQPHKLLLPNCSPCLGPCKWQPPRLPFELALVTNWYQYPGCPPCMCVVPLYKRAGSPDPLLTFWLNVILVTSRSKTRNLT